MRILGIESSCDDSAVAYLEVKRGKVARLEYVVASQVIHEKYGGVVPEVAAREHSAKIPPILDALAEKVIGKPDGRAFGEIVDAVAATAGPGLVTSLRVGLDTGRALAAAWDKDFYAINHIEGHIYSNWLPGEKGKAKLDESSDIFPAIALVVSGGHTELLLMKGHGQYKLLGATADDAAGEAFDKSAKLMGLGYPGGPAISNLAKGGDPSAYDFPRPLLNSDDLRFSFSGLKTAVRYFLRDNEDRFDEKKFLPDVAASTEQAIVDVLVAKAVSAAKKNGVRTVLLAGGVAANPKLRATLAAELKKHVPKVRFVEPELVHCTDNAGMIAMAAYHQSQLRKPDDWRKIEADPLWELGR
ncbi:MAG: tRNA (adenosine(37)-N6)-threonylcarbamoyltransferase complex transferase subunit TsaD [Patescibacteria group bacterium]|nr:tRNA (adenosine(37)-N6)-threonylcarbamoyltransferase complex transferase subunit TsaD [Patescibacteria group bacterium]